MLYHINRSLPIGNCFVHSIISSLWSQYDIHLSEGMLMGMFIEECNENECKYNYIFEIESQEYLKMKCLII